MVDSNNVNVEGLQKAVAEIKADRNKARRTQKISGQWLFHPGGPQFQAEVVFEGGKVVMESDGATNMGGEGRRPGPLHYCFYGLLSCYTSIFVATASTMGIKLRKVTSQVEADLDFSRVYGLSMDPIVNGVRVLLKVDSDATRDKLEEANRLAHQRCPAVYSLTERIKIDARLESV